ncbi:MAG: VCBS repeat-containing protein [Bacteroidota bacterium]
MITKFCFRPVFWRNWLLLSVHGLLLGALTFAPGPIAGQSTFGLPQVSVPAIAAGYHDTDSFPDLFISGLDSAGNIVTDIMANNSGTSFSGAGAGLTKVWRAAAAWGDYDGDGREDLFVTGDQGNKSYVATLYRNVSGTLTATAFEFEGFSRGSTFWADLDNDSDLDLFVMGLTNRHGVRSLIYENTGSGFQEISDSSFFGLIGGDADHGDFDNDGDEDILISGVPSEGGGRTALFENQGNMVFTLNHNALKGIQYGTSRLADLDGDNDLDIIAVGGEPGYSARVYEVDGGCYLPSPFLLPGIIFGSAVTTDYNQDGYPDVIISGFNQNGKLLEVYRNNAGESFSQDQAAYPLEGMHNSRILIADINRDGEVDFIVAGLGATDAPRTYVYQYDAALSPPRFQ